MAESEHRELIARVARGDYSPEGGEFPWSDLRTIARSCPLSCKAVYHGVVGYMPNSRPIKQEGAGGGGTPGQDGSVVVGRFSFRIG